MRYEEALTELDGILTDLREGNVGVDDLADRVKRAETLISWCRDRLRKVEGQLDDLAQSTTPSDLP